MKFKKLANSAVHDIKPALEGHYLLCRRNRFDLIMGLDVENPILKSANISNASDMFLNAGMNQVLFVNTSGKGFLYDLLTKEKISNISLGHEMFGTGVANDSKNFYYINKKNRIMKLSQDGEKSLLVFEDETDVDDIIFSDGRCFIFRKKYKENYNLNNYEVKCYVKDKITATNIISGIDSIDKRVLDYDLETIVMLVHEPSNQRGWMLQRSIGVFNKNSMTYCSIFTIPNEWGVIYGYATCLQENLLALADGKNVYIVDLKSGDVIDKMSDEYFFTVAFMNSKELLIGSWKGLYWAELE